MDLATPAQVNFVNVLLSERDVPAAIAEQVKSEPLSRVGASLAIETLKAYPRIMRASAPSPWDALRSAFEGVEDSRYALPGDVVRAALPSLYKTVTSTGLLFLEVKTYKGRRYLNRLHGAPGDFVRSRFNPQDTRAILDVIRGQHVTFSRLFGEHFTVCGRCAAPLTDERSRAQFLGPECAKVWGLR